ncbi:uncharacterized protein LOC105431105 isoform X2 [Pogonomyrmex barbatus]|uniref:Uncharacterized protein LOC105431105 isoform X2 n=1 Tax=Pogonomyrmex barbatus TaxID=144034 RepID=A0A6I9WNH7_9HYME|nr:uncharacterized protein LOC105431105 isoform X2 [Pogonomyrmex barbatus]
MSYNPCFVCLEPPDDNKHRRMFDEKWLINLEEENISKKSDGHKTVKAAIELILGYKVPEIYDIILCQTCFHKVESYIKFRSRLIKIFETYNSIISNSSNLINSEISESDISKEVTNINEENVSSNISNISNSYSLWNIETENDSYATPLPNFHHNIDNVSDHDSDIDDNLNSDISPSKIQKSDIESDINVYSGEDNEILELSIKYEHDEVLNLSSAESEEEADYGPTFKKIKLSNQISPLILF